MDVQYIELEKITANQKKMRKNHNITRIAESIRQNGWTQPIVVDEPNRVLVSTGRLLAARMLNLDKIPVVIKTGLTEAQKQALALRTGKQFSASRKLGKCHQNVLLFVKGDPRKATQKCGDVETFVLDEFENQ